jgi:hypothetical protein
VRTPSLLPSRFVCALVLASVVGLAGCGGGGSSLPNPGSTAVCDFNSAGLQLARPTFGFPQNGSQIEIVDNGNADQLAQFTNMFDLDLRDNFGNVITTTLLAGVADPGGPHPYSSDFFYAGTPQNSLLPGRTYSVFLNAPNTNCTPGLVGTFST